MPFDGSGGYIGSSRSASANTNKLLSVSADAAGFFGGQEAINTDGLCGMSILVTQIAGVPGTGAARLLITPRGDGVPYPGPPTVVPLVGVPVLIPFNHIASRAVQVECSGSNAPGNPNIYRILFMACI